MPSALTRYRVMAFIVGSWLILLVCVAVPLKYLANSPGMVAVVGPIHGVLYIIYVLLALDLSIRQRWSFVRIVAIALAGTVPFLTFVAEHYVTRWVREADAARSEAAAAAPGGSRRASLRRTP